MSNRQQIVRRTGFVLVIVVSIVLVVLPLIARFALSALDNTGWPEHSFPEPTDINGYINSASQHASNIIGIWGASKLNSINAVDAFLDCNSSGCNLRQLILRTSVKTSQLNLLIPSSSVEVQYVFNLPEDEVLIYTSPVVYGKTDEYISELNWDEMTIWIDEAIELFRSANVVDNSEYSVYFGTLEQQNSIADWCVRVQNREENIYLRIHQPNGEITGPTTEYPPPIDCNW